MRFPFHIPFICKDCVVVFSLHTKRKRNPFCPHCGDDANVHRYERTKKQEKQFWTEEELQLVDRIIEGELLAYQVANKLGRTSQSVRNRVIRRRKETNK